MAETSTTATSPTAASPYEGLPARAFWSRGVANHELGFSTDLHDAKFEIDKETRFVTAGSCFAQHLARALRRRGYNVLDGEPAPAGMPIAEQHKYGFGMYSCRYGNIYTARQLLQLAREAEGEFKPARRFWKKNGRFYDAQRPNVEPDGLRTRDFALEARRRHLARVKDTFSKADVFVFTFGLTETWEHIESGTVFPTAPGTIAGRYKPEVFRFKNLSYGEVYDDFLAFRSMLQQWAPGVKFLITVSPVPLTATAAPGHILPNTVYSKSVLRAVCGALTSEFEDIDYFPSYEIITAPSTGGRFYEENMRSVRPEGVETVMRVFFGETVPGADAPPVPASRRAEPALLPSDDLVSDDLVSDDLVSDDLDDEDDVVCEEVLLEAFGESAT